MIPIHFGSTERDVISTYNVNVALPVGDPGSVVVSYAVPVGRAFRITSWKAVGSDRGHAKLKIDGLVKDDARIVGEQLNPYFYFGETGAILATAGQVIEILIINYGVGPSEFSARLGGYLI